MARLTPWARIVRAGNRCTGVSLDKADIQQLMQDDAVVTRGIDDLWAAGRDENGVKCEAAAKAAKEGEGG